MRLRALALLGALLPAAVSAQELRSPPGLQSGGLGDVSGMGVLTPGASSAVLMAARLAEMPLLDQYVQAGDSANDYSPAFGRAMAACSAKGGGLVSLSTTQRQYRLATGGTIPTGCSVVCPAPLVGNSNPTNYQNIPYTVRLPSTATITMNKGSGWAGCNALADNSFNPTNTREHLTLASGFAGTAFTTTADVTIRDAFVGGFNVGIAATTSSARTRIYNTNIDANTCLQSYNSHDITHLGQIHCFPFMNSGAGAVVPYNITGVANNGSGLYRVTLSASTAIQTGDTVWIKSAVGASSINNRWTATIVNATTVDLQGSSATGGTKTVSTSNGSNVVTVTAGGLANLGIGASVSGSGIPGGATVLGLAPTLGAVIISSPATATATGVALTFADAAWSSGGVLTISSQQRSGPGFDFQTSETTQGVDLFSFGHTTCFRFGDGAGGIALTNPSCDQDNSIADPNTVGFLVEGTSYDTTIVTGNASSIGRALVINNTGGDSTTIVGTRLNNNSNTVMAEFVQGSATLIGTNSSPNGKLQVFGNSIGPILHLGSNSQHRPIFAGGAAVANYRGLGNYQLSNTYAGTQAFVGQNVFGGGGATCGTPLVTCWTRVDGVMYDNTFGTTSTLVEGGTWTPSGNANSLLMHGTSNLTNYTLNLGSPSNNGQTIELYFDVAIANLTTTGAASQGMPSSIAANTWHRCKALSNKWYCQ